MVIIRFLQYKLILSKCRSWNLGPVLFVGQFYCTNLNSFQPISMYFNQLQLIYTILTKFNLSHKKAQLTSTYFNPLQPSSPFYPPQFTYEKNRPLRQNVAIKKSHPKDCENAEHLELKARYQNELKLGMFEHNNIVKLIGYDESEKHVYLMYERVEGMVLEDLIEGEISWTNALKVLMGLASALRYLQSHPDGPFVHCYVCPPNILVEKVGSLLQHGTPKLIDFGLCVAVGEKKLGGHQGYFFREKEGLASSALDVFSFGVVAVHLLAKDSRNYFKNSYGLPEPIVNFYINQFQERASIVSREFGDRKAAIHVSQVIVTCRRMDNLPNIGEVWSQLKQLLWVNMYFLGTNCCDPKEVK